MQSVLIAAGAYSMFQFFSGFAAQKLSDSWFLLFGTVSIVFFTLLVTSVQLVFGSGLGNKSLDGFLLIFLANGFITVFTFFLGRSFQSMPATFVVPFVFGGALLASTLMNYAYSRHFPSAYELVSLLMVSGGLIMMGIKQVSN